MAFERPSNPSNHWACLRTLDAYGVQDVHVVPDTLEHAAARAAARGVTGETEQHRNRHRKMTKASKAQSWLNVREYASATELVDDLHSRGYRVAATDLGAGSEAIGTVDWASEPTVLCFGNEEVGISDELRRLADLRVHLPMKGLAESLNLSVSVAACLSFISAKGALEPDLAENQQRELLLEWSLAAVEASLATLPKSERSAARKAIAAVRARFET